MYKLILVIPFLIINTSGKLLENGGNIDTIDGDPLWVLNLNDEEWLSPKLRLGNTGEVEDYYYYIAPQFESYQSSKRVKKNDPALSKKSTINNENSTESNLNVKKDMWKMINKFALSAAVEPDSYIENYEDGPSISLYFKGSHTACVVKTEKEQWHYIMARSSLPSWFYEQHDTQDAPINIPENIKNKFYTSLLRYLEILFRHPM